MSKRPASIAEEQHTLPVWIPCTSYLGASYAFLGRLDDAERILLRSLAVATELHVDCYAARWRTFLGEVFLRTSRFDRESSG